MSLTPTRILHLPSRPTERRVKDGLTPAHFVNSRIAMDYVYPLPFVLGWVLSLLISLDQAWEARPAGATRYFDGGETLDMATVPAGSLLLTITSTDAACGGVFRSVRLKR